MAEERDLSRPTQEQKVLGKSNPIAESVHPGYVTKAQQLASNEVSVAELNKKIQARRELDEKPTLPEENENS